MTSGRVERRSAVPYYLQMKDMLVADLESGRLKPGDRLPGEHDLCDRFGVSRTVVRQALGELEAEGRLRRHKGRGTFVASPKVAEAMIESFSGLAEDVAARGGTLRNEVRRLEVAEAPHAVAGELELAEGERVIVLERLRIVDGRPWSLVTTFIPHARFPGLEGEDFVHESLYALIEGKYGVPIAHGRRTIEAIPADAETAAALGVQPRDPLLLLTSTAYDEDGAPIEHFVARHRADATSFEVRVMRRHPSRRVAPAAPVMTIRQDSASSRAGLSTSSRRTSASPPAERRRGTTRRGR
jgi:GntR family transcriptional regulator